MARYQNPRRSDEKWFQLINECRRSGLSDSRWCKQHDIKSSTFFCAIKRLRQKAYAIPDHDDSMDVIQNALPRQDVVRINIEPDPIPLSRSDSMQALPVLYPDNSHTMEIGMHGINLRVYSSVDTELLKTVLTVLGGARC